MDNELLEQVLTATREQTRIETERLQAERSRLSEETRRCGLEEQRIKVEQETRTLLYEVIDVVRAFSDAFSHVPSEHSEQRMKLEFLVEMVKVVLVRMRGEEEAQEEIDRLQRIILAKSLGREAVSVSFNAGRDVHDVDIGSVAQQSVPSEAMIKGLVTSITTLVDAERYQEAENVMDSLGEDIIDVVLAAMQGPLAAAGAIIEKISGKVKIRKA